MPLNFSTGCFRYAAGFDEYYIMQPNLMALGNLMPDFRRNLIQGDGGIDLR